MANSFICFVPVSCIKLRGPDLWGETGRCDRPPFHGSLVATHCTHRWSFVDGDDGAYDSALDRKYAYNYFNLTTTANWSFEHMSIALLLNNYKLFNDKQSSRIYFV